MAEHEDMTLLEKVRERGERAVEQAAAGDWEGAAESFARLAWICQGADWMEHQASATG